jgi:uncharacterized membrane protein HdeD (DUF308 family)
MSTFSLLPEPLTALPRLLARNWWLFLLRGIAAVAFGMLSLVWPGISLYVLTVLFGAYALVDGVFALAAAISGMGENGIRGWLALVGLAGIAAGIATFFWPAVTTLTLLYFIAAWVVVTGVFQIVGSVELRKVINDEWWLILDGALAVLFGILVFAVPGAGALALIWMIAIFAIAFGLMMIGFALKLRQFKAHTA